MAIAEIRKGLNRPPFFRNGLSLIDHWRMRRYFTEISVTRLEDRMREAFAFGVERAVRRFKAAQSGMWIRLDFKGARLL